MFVHVVNCCVVCMFLCYGWLARASVCGSWQSFVCMLNLCVHVRACMGVVVCDDMHVSVYS